MRRRIILGIVYYSMVRIPCLICKGGAPGNRRNIIRQGFVLGRNMGKMNLVNLKKAIYYLKRNGWKNTVNAVAERLDSKGQPDYRFEPVSRETLQRQREQTAAGFSHILFSIVVPAYRTPEAYLREMLESVINQTYSGWELILADATEDDSVRKIVETYKDSRVKYHRLAANSGISENTNVGIACASGDYVGLLDHDDVLTENALFEMASAIEQGRKQGIELQLLYSDEDKCDGEMKKFYEPNIKEKFNLDLLLSNNYICHFLVMKREMIQELKLRKEYDGAQDFDLVLRAADMLKGREKETAHIPLVLYHWRCHASSTAENPRSKMYAYDAGRRAVQDFVNGRGWKAVAVDTEHLGFYRLKYQENPFKVRPELGAVGGRVVSRGRIIGGRLTGEGKALYGGLPVSYSGYMHRAVLQQDAEVLDIRNLELRKSLWELFSDVVGIPYTVLPGTGIFDVSTLPENTDYIRVSIKLSKALRERGYTLLYLPERASV